MKHKKESLTKLLQLIDEISTVPENEWFKEILCKKFSTAVIGKSGGNSPNDTLQKIVELHRFLMLDVVPIIDYSIIEDKVVQNQLYRDCIEMGRHRLGKINNVINFGEFCRYAHLQAEELVNYFFIKKFNDNIEQIVKFIKEYNWNYKPEKPATDIHHIYYTIKLTAFKNFSALSKNTFDDLYFLNDLRNELSHRNSFTANKEDEILKDFDKMGFSSKKLDWDSLSPEAKELYRKGKYIINKRKEDYLPIYKTLEELFQKVVSCLSSEGRIGVDKVHATEKIKPILVKRKIG